MDLLELSRLYAKASDDAYQANKYKDEADLAESEEEREYLTFLMEASLSALERIELKIQALKLTIPVA